MRHFIGLVSDSRLEEFSRENATKWKFLHFLINFNLAQPAPVPGNTDLGYHLSRLYQNTQHISCSVLQLSMFPFKTLQIWCKHIEDMHEKINAEKKSV